MTHAIEVVVDIQQSHQSTTQLQSQRTEESTASDAQTGSRKVHNPHAQSASRMKKKPKAQTKQKLKVKGWIEQRHNFQHHSNIHNTVVTKMCYTSQQSERKIRDEQRTQYQLQHLMELSCKDSQRSRRQLEDKPQLLKI